MTSLHMHTIYIYIHACFGFTTCNTDFTNQVRRALNIDVKKGLTTFPQTPACLWSFARLPLVKAAGCVTVRWYQHTVESSQKDYTCHALTARVVGLLTYPFPLPLFLFSFSLFLPSYSWHPLIKQLQSKTLHTAGWAGCVTQHPALESCWHEWESGRASRGATIIVGPLSCPTRMLVRHELIAVRCTLETGGGCLEQLMLFKSSELKRGGIRS